MPGAPEAKRQEADERRPPPEIAPVLAVERGGVASRVGGGRIRLAAARCSTALAAPDHRLALGDEAVAVTGQAAAEHATRAYELSPAAIGKAGER